MDADPTAAPVGAAVVDWDREEQVPLAFARTLRTGVR